MKMVFATHNKGKLIEMGAMLKGFDVISAKEAGVFEDVVEDGETFAENALKKARFVAKKTGNWAVGDDSGLCIKSLGGEPGIYTARWAVEGASDEDLVNYTLEKMKNITEGDREAYFESAVALVSPSGQEYIFSGRIHGLIPLKPAGVAIPNLPYDVIFIPKGHNMTFAQMDNKEKNSMSHRGLAFEKLKKFIKKEFT